MSNFYIQIQNDEMYAPLSPMENSNLVLEAKTSQTAYDQAINHNLRLVMKLANKYNHTPMSFDDRFQNGYNGLEYAVRSFDPKFGQNFGTYAYTCIRGYITNGLHEEGSNITMPSALRQRINKFKRFSNEYQMKHGYEPNDEEICEHLDISNLQLERMRHAMSGMIFSIHQEVGEDSEMECFISGEDNITNEDVSENQTLDGFTSNPVDVLCRNERSELIHNYVNRLSDVEKFIVKNRMNGMKLEQVAILLKTQMNFERTLQCVQQIEIKSYEKIQDMFLSPAERLQMKKN